MEKTVDILNAKMSAAFEKAGLDKSYGRVNLSNRPDLCEYQCNGAMALAKIMHKKPIEIAESVVEILKGEPAFKKAEAVMPGFINLDISEDFLAGYLADMDSNEGLGLEPVAKDGEKAPVIIIDYGGANVAKPLHVGHLRSAVIGESIKRLGARMGNKMIGDVHLGDWGLQMGLIIEELKDRDQTEFDLSDLEEIYPAASTKSKEKGEDGKLTERAEKFKERALKATEKLQSGDPECTKIWKRIMELSLADLKKNYDSLNVSFELWKGESDVQKYIPDMLKDFEDRGIAYESQGALVVDIAEETDTKELPPCIVRKSDGASLYATTDLATMVERELLYKPDAYIYIADQRQSLHYTSFFRVARKAGIVRDDESLTFLGFGTMNGKDGKPFKTREGGVLRLSALVNEINEKVYEKIRENRSTDEISDEEAKSIAETVGLAALKYGDLSNQASKDYIFDIDRFTSFEGNTGPYILYSIVRISSILKKYAEGTSASESASVPESRETFAAAVSESKASKALSLLLSRYNEVISLAWKELAPHKICQYIYEISDAFNSFYHETKILSEEDEEKKRSYIALLSLTRKVLTDCIDILGFKAPEKM